MFTCERPLPSIICASAAEPRFTIVISLCAALASWHFALVEHYQNKSCLAEANHVKSIPQNITIKAASNVAQGIL